jgi:hypothetical protein
MAIVNQTEQSPKGKKTKEEGGSDAREAYEVRNECTDNPMRSRIMGAVTTC